MGSDSDVRTPDGSANDAERLLSRDRCLTVLEQFPAMTWRANTTGERDWFSTAWLGFTGRTLDQEQGTGWMQGVHTDDLERCTRIWTQQHAARQPFEMEIRLLRSDGVYRWVRDSGRPFEDAGGEFLGFIGASFDITDLHEYSAELAHLASHDVLTQLLNRHGLEAELQRAIAYAQRGTESTLLFTDVDRFKACNDEFGHEFGDGVLKAIAVALKQSLREVDIVARAGGDEFAIVLWGQDSDSAREVSERLADAVMAAGRELGCDIGLSVGMAPVSSGRQVAQILAEADRAMYEAKAASDVGDQ